MADEKQFTQLEEQIIKLACDEDQGLSKALHYNNSRLDITYGIVFLLVFKIAADIDVLSAWHYAGIVCNVLGILLFTGQLLYLIQSMTQASVETRSIIRDMSAGFGGFDEVKNFIQRSKESKKQKMNSDWFLALLIFEGILFGAALILVLIP